MMKQFSSRLTIILIRTIMRLMMGNTAMPPLQNGWKVPANYQTKSFPSMCWNKNGYPICSAGIYELLAVSLSWRDDLLAIDSLTKDRRHKSLFLSLPVTVDEILWAKTAALFIVSTLMMISTLVLIWIGVGCQFGFGSLDLPVSILSSSFDARYPISSADVLYTPCWSFLTSVIGVGIVLQLIYIRGILLLSTLWRSELANLFLAGFGLISPLIFQRRWFSAFLDKSNDAYLYQNYGQILSGFSRFYFGSSEFVLAKGLLLLV